MSIPDNSLAEFYPYYLEQHRDARCRAWHFAGTALGLAALVAAIVTANAWLVLAGLGSAYACAWSGHFLFEKNTPAAFTNPFYSFVCDFMMFRDLLLGRLSWRDSGTEKSQ
ncbi:DUF962 domain-containing protein [Microbulbifer marinus]|uniref:Transmembrane protein n=1 Tax=Microbulbifer marinus TaxID=658218 RepID=A0A1H4A2Y1_9GAMM|nr:DUF962 domain-containing protein [Microbulbifer marinus]SEA29882.1 hypothetical protein SAMN05216562_2486 [Microbulbifer marinus]